MFGYVLNGAQTKSLLASVTEFGSDGTSSMPPVRFAYRRLDGGFNAEVAWTTPGERWIRRVDGDSDTVGDVFDVNGDGLPDLVSFDTNHWDIWLNTRTGFAESALQWSVDPEWAIRQVNAGSDGKSADTMSSPMDINRDGYSDFVYAKADTTLQVRTNNGGGFSDVSNWPLPIRASVQEVENTNSGGAPNVYQEFFDINGDDRPDLVERQSGGWHVWRNTESGFVDYGVWPVWHSSMYLWDFTRDTPNLEIGRYDMNGDGLEDIVDSAGGDWLVYFNTGSDFLPPEIWPTGYSGVIRDPDTSGNVKRDLLDINGDGLPDIVNPPNGSSLWDVRLNTGHGFAAKSAWPAPSSIPADGFTRDVVPDNNGSVRRDLLDIDGDGAVDVVRKTDSNWQVASNRSGQADLLVRITDTLGGTVDVNYGPSGAYSNTRLPFNFWVVTALTKHNGMTGPHAISATTRFSYGQGLYDFPTREFRGFAQVTVSRPDGAKEIHYFHQDEGKKGKEFKLETKNAENAPFAATENVWSAPGANGVYVARLDQTDELSFDGIADGPKTKRTQFQNYDDFGNVGLEIRQGDAAVDGDEAYVYQEFAVNPEQWIVDRLAHTYITGSPGGPMLRESWFGYDGVATGTPPVTGNLTEEKQFLNTGPSAITRYHYDAYGNRIQAIDPEGRTTKIEFDSSYHTFPTQVTNAKGQESKREYNPVNGEVVLEIDPNGFQTRFLYDVFQRKIAEIRPYDSEAFPTTQIQYDLDGAAPEQIVVSKREISGQSGTLQTAQYVDGDGNLIQTRTEPEQGNKWITVNTFYDLLERVQQQSNAYLSSNAASYMTPDTNIPAIRYDYDAMSRPVRITNPDGTQVNRVFDHWAVTETDENSHSKLYSFDAFQRLLQVVERNAGDSYTTRYEYDPAGQMRKIIDHAGNITIFNYDTLGRKTAMSDPDLGNWRYGYDRVGNLISQTDARGITTQIQYDALNRKSLVDYPNDPDQQYIYDHGVIGTLSKVAHPLGSTSFEYDQRLRKIRETRTLEGHAWTTRWSHDALDRIVNQTDPDGQMVAFSYNSQGLLNSIPGVITNLNYNASGRMTVKTYANGKTTTYNYNPQNLRLSRISSPGIQNLSYTYDSAGNIKSIHDSIAGKTETFGYDDLDRLASAGDSGYSEQFAYNAIGNLLSVNHNGFTNAYTYATGAAGPHAVVGMTVPEPRLGSFVLRYGDAYTLGAEVPLNAAVIGRADEYMASENENFAGASWQPYTTTPVIRLSTGYGQKTVYFKVRYNGNQSQVKSDSIYYAPDKDRNGVPDHYEIDVDMDGLPDAWEKTYGLNPINGKDGTSDKDSDGLKNINEFLNGSNPRTGDTDNDGWNDAQELAKGSSPTDVDSDHDGIKDPQDVNLQSSEQPMVSTHFAVRTGHFSAGGGRRSATMYALSTDSLGKVFGKLLFKASVIAYPSLHDFGGVVMPNLSKPQSFSLKNISGSNALIETVIIKGQANDYRKSNDTCSGISLTPGNQCTFQILLMPIVAGIRQAAIEVATGATLRHVAELSGIGIDLDSDKDGMPDVYEVDNELDFYNPFDAQQDADHDGRTNLDEYLAGTDPNDSSRCSVTGVVTQVIVLPGNQPSTIYIRSKTFNGTSLGFTSPDGSIIKGAIKALTQKTNATVNGNGNCDQSGGNISTFKISK